MVIGIIGFFSLAASPASQRSKRSISFDSLLISSSGLKNEPFWLLPLSQDANFP